MSKCGLRVDEEGEQGLRSNQGPKSERERISLGKQDTKVWKGDAEGRWNPTWTCYEAINTRLQCRLAEIWVERGIAEDWRVESWFDEEGVIWEGGKVIAELVQVQKLFVKAKATITKQKIWKREEEISWKKSNKSTSIDFEEGEKCEVAQQFECLLLRPDLKSCSEITQERTSYDRGNRHCDWTETQVLKYKRSVPKVKQVEFWLSRIMWGRDVEMGGK